MIGVLLLSHGTLCEGMCNAMELLGVEMDGVRAMPLFMDRNIDDYTQDVARAIDELDTGDGVLVLADLTGGTPFNRVCSLLEKHIEIVSGLNFTMAITAVDMRDSNTLDKLAEICVEEGKRGIMNVRSLL